MKKDKIQIKVLDQRIDLFRPERPMSAGYDLCACIDEELILKNGDPAQLVPTGLAIFINDADIAALIVPRSGLGHKQGLVLGNGTGLIDGDYQGQWFVSVTNRGQCDEIVIKPMDRIAQAFFIPVIHPEFVKVEEFDQKTERGTGGFGSTGK